MGLSLRVDVSKLTLAAIEVTDDAGNIESRLRVRRNPVVAIDGLGARIVGGERKHGIVLIAREQPVKISGAAGNVLIGSKAVVHAQRGRGAGHKLHQAARSSAGDGAGIAIAFGVDDAGEQVGVDVMRRSHLSQNGGDVSFLGFDRTRGRCDFGCVDFNRLLDDDVAGGDVEVAVVGGSQVETNSAGDAGLMVADDIKAGAQGDAFGGEGGECGEDGQGQGCGGALQRLALEKLALEKKRHGPTRLPEGRETLWSIYHVKGGQLLACSR